MVGIDFGVKQQAGEVGKGGEDDDAEQDARDIAQLQFVKMYRSDDAEDDRDGDRDSDFALAGGQRQRCSQMRQRFASDSVAPQAERHADGGGAEAVMEADVFLQEAGDERAEETADVDGDVENGKTGIAQRAQLFVFIKRADHRTGGCLDAAAAEGDADQTGNHAVHAGDESKSDMAAHDEDARVKQGAFRAPEAVS